MRVVVTGGAGFLGSHLCRALLGRGDEVVAIDNLSTGSLRNIEALFGNERFTFQHHNVSNFVHVPGHVDAVLHFASPASPADFERIPIPILKVGSLGTHNTLGLAKDKSARYLLASTSEVYGDPLVHPQPETYWGNVNPVGPRGVYDEAKRFAEAMTMAYHRHHDVDVRIVRIFNSVLADEQVLYDDGRELRRESIQSLADRLGASSADLRGYSVPSFDDWGRMASRPAIALVGHPPSGPCFRVRTRYGREVRVTGDHSVFARGPDGDPVARPVSDLRIGDYVAIAGRVAVPQRDRYVVHMADVWMAAGCDPWKLNVRAPGLGMVAMHQRFDLVAAVRRHVPTTNKDPKRGSWGYVKGCIDRSQIPLGAMQALGLRIPPSAQVRLRTARASSPLPSEIVLTDELLWLLGLYVAEGCRFEAPHDSFITISCDEETLDRAAKIVDRDLELHVVRAAPSPARSGAIFVHSKLLLLLLDHLGFTSGPKRIPGWVLGLPLSRLKWFIEGYREGDGVHSGAKFVEGKRHEFSTTSDHLKDDLIVAFGRFGLVPSVGRYESTMRHKTGDRRYPFWRLTLCDVDPWSPLDWDRGVRQRLNARRHGDLVWATVMDVSEVEPTELVYDFSVPGEENFWAGSGVMCHNTYGPQMRPDDGRSVSNFLVQALTGKPLTVYGDGSQTRSFCYADDEVRGFLSLLESDYVGPVNIGNPNEYTILELAEAVLEVTGSSSPIEFRPLPVDDPTQRKPDITLAQSLFSWKPEVDLHSGLAKTAEWFRNA